MYLMYEVLGLLKKTVVIIREKQKIDFFDKIYVIIKNKI